MQALEGLRHILWLGGAPDAGKMTAATLLAKRYGLATYRFDRHELAHFARHA